MSRSPTASNLLELLGVAGREDVVTNLLAHCYNCSATFRTWFLRSLGILGAGDVAQGAAYARVQVGDSGVPDLLIVGHDGTNRSIVVLENKLTAGEGNDQTKRYSSPACIDGLAQRFHLDRDTLIPRFVFLTLLSEERPASEKFMPVCYDTFLKNDILLSDQDGPWVLGLVHAWLDVLSRFYESSRLSPDDCLLDRLRNVDPLEGAFLAFRSFMQSVPCPRGLSYLGSSRSSQPGRRYYLTQFGKASWHPGRIDQSAKKWILDPATCFNIHVEPQFSVLDGRFSVALHYETNPYLSHKDAKAGLRPRDYEAYRQRRDKFIGIFHDVCPEDLKVGGRWNQVASANISLEKLSVTTCRRRLGVLLTQISNAVDSTLEELHGTAGPA